MQANNVIIVWFLRVYFLLRYRILNIKVRRKVLIIVNDQQPNELDFQDFDLFCFLNNANYKVFKKRNPSASIKLYFNARCSVDIDEDNVETRVVGVSDCFGRKIKRPRKYYYTGFPNLLQFALYDLLKSHRCEITILGGDLFLGDFRNRSRSAANKTEEEYREAILKHDPVANFNYLNFLHLFFHISFVGPMKEIVEQGERAYSNAIGERLDI